MSESRIDWKRISEGDFNEIAESLIVRNRSGNGMVAQAVDGRGGDGGIDIDVRVERTRQLTEILQLKWFPEGFSNKFSDRKKQIQHSLERAMEHSPGVWTLVVPANLTVNERKSVWAMQKGRKLLIRFIGATELNLLLAEQPHVHDWATRNVALDALSRVGREQAALSKPGDLANEALRLHGQAEGVSAYWGRNWSVRGDAYCEELYAKRPDAAEREPLSFVIATAFGPEDADLRKAFQKSLSYGVVEPLILPGHVVTSFTKIGPDWFAGESDVDELHLLPLESDKRDLRLAATVYDASGRRLSSISGRTSYAASGPEGGTLSCSYAGGLGQRWRLPRDRAQPGVVEMSFHPAGHAARDIQRIMLFLESMPSASRICLSIDGQTHELGLPGAAEALEPNPALRELIEDLAYIETVLNVEFRFPDELPGAFERVWIRVIRLMLSGSCAVLPNAQGFDVTLNGKPDTADSGIFGEGAALFIGNDEWTVDILGEELFIGSMGVYHPNVVADDGAEHLASLLAGTASGRSAHLRPNDETPFRIYSPARITSNGNVHTEAWGLHGLPEHRLFANLPPAIEQ